MKAKLFILSLVVSMLVIVSTNPADAGTCLPEDEPCFENTTVEVDSSYTLAELKWKEASFPIKNGTSFATVILIDADSNQNPNYKETVNVLVYSDSDSEGNVIELKEAENNSGIFEKTFGISSHRTAPNVLFTQEGDTITTVYYDLTLPPGHFLSESHLVSTALVGSTGPPLERILLSSARFTDINKNKIDFPIVQEQFLLTSDIANQQDHNQTFVWIAQITDNDRKVEALSWIEGTLNTNTSFSPTTSWIPTREGHYNVVFFVWESLTNPTALSPPIEMDFVVQKERPENIPFKEITITLGEPINKNGLLPIITTETTRNVENLDSVTDWHFLPLNHGEWGPTGERLSWDTLARKDRIHNFIGERDGKTEELEANFFRNDILRTYEANCQGEKIQMLSADPIQISIPENLSSVSVMTSDAGLLPVDGLYSLRFASFFDQEVTLPENAKVVSYEEKQCTVNNEQKSGKYVNVVFKLEAFPDDFEFSYSFGVGEKNSYNSETDTYVTDMVCDDPITTTVPLTDTEKSIIWESISENGFFQMDDFTENCDSNGNCVMMEPESRITLSVTADGKNHSVSSRDSYIGKNGELFSRFDKIIDAINEIFKDKDELRFLPKPRCAYL